MLSLNLFKYDYIITYDFECRFSHLVNNDEQTRLKWLSTQIPLSVAIATNFPGYDIKFIYNKDTNELINQMFKYIYELTLRIGAYMIKKFQYLLNDLDRYSVNNRIKKVIMIMLIKFL